VRRLGLFQALQAFCLLAGGQRRRVRGGPPPPGPRAARRRPPGGGGGPGGGWPGKHMALGVLLGALSSIASSILAARPDNPGHAMTRIEMITELLRPWAGL